MNLFGYDGYLTKEDRKKPLEHGSILTFTSNIDLSDGVTITAYRDDYLISTSEYTKHVASFTAWWMINVFPNLNGFSGLDCVDFNITNFKII